MVEFLTYNALYVVLLVAMVVWLGIALYISRLDSRVAKLERDAVKYFKNNDVRK